VRSSSAPAPGAWLRLTALAASGATLLAVVSGALALDTAHRLLSALALPPLAALAVAAVLRHRRLVPAVAAAVVLFGVAALATHEGVHLAAAGAAFAATLVLTVQAFRGERVPAGAWRDYVTLTKPRIMSLLLITGLGGMFVGAGGAPGLGLLAATMAGLALACGGASALNHVLDEDIDRLMGKRTERRPVAAGRIAAPRADVMQHEDGADAGEDRPQQDMRTREIQRLHAGTDHGVAELFHEGAGRPICIPRQT